MQMYGAVYTGRESKIATVIKEAMDQVHKFPHMGKFLHLIRRLYCTQSKAK